MKIAIINGPNLNLIGTRETDVYGSESFEHFFAKLRKKYEKIGLELGFRHVESGALVRSSYKAQKHIL